MKVHVCHSSKAAHLTTLRSLEESGPRAPKNLTGTVTVKCTYSHTARWCRSTLLPRELAAATVELTAFGFTAKCSKMKLQRYFQCYDVVDSDLEYICCWCFQNLLGRRSWSVSYVEIACGFSSKMLRYRWHWPVWFVFSFCVWASKAPLFIHIHIYTYVV